MTIQRALSTGMALAIGLFLGTTASAVPIDFSAGALGELDPLENIDFGDPGDETSMVVEGFYNPGSGWTATNLYRRRQTNDNGLGVCSPGDRTQNGNTECPGPSGGGDWNEVDNDGDPELIRLSLPGGFTWTSVGLSSLDNNGGSGAERGRLWADDNGDLSDGFGTLVTSFEFTGPIEPDILIPMAFASAPFLIFEPFDWSVAPLTLSSTPSDNNDFLVRAAVITPTQVPEPATLLLLAAGLGFAAVTRRRS